jgi:hypothetical protein
VYVAPCERSLTDDAPDTEKNNDVLARYFDVWEAERAAVTPSPSNPTRAMTNHRR